MNELTAYGWDDAVANSWQQIPTDGLVPGRVVADFGTSLKVATPEIITAELSGKLAHYTNKLAAPKIGDWVAVRRSDSGHAVIESTLERRSEIARKVAGKQSRKQIIAANVDVAFILLAVDKDFSVERLRRFLFQLSINRIAPVVVLNKTDKTDDLDSYVRQIEPFEVPVLTTIATEEKGIASLLDYIPEGKTAILLGSSGVGKSTITNKLLGRDLQPTQTVRESDDTGKHTTVHRELFVLPHGGLLIDTPGIRELQLWGTEDDLYANYDDVAKLTSQCYFTTCSHGDEEGCAVQHALRTGLLPQEKYTAFLRLKDEVRTLASRKQARERSDNAKSKRSLHKQHRDLMNEMRDDMLG
jgi:ribosome biogenesis GTPase